MEKGFFMSPTDRSWTCYRRNYFSVACSFELHPHVANGRLFLRGHQVQAMGMRLSAAVDGPGGKVIELVQYTPKRDVGDKSPVEIQKVSPSPPAKDRQPEQSIAPQGVYQLPLSTFHHAGQPTSPLLPLQSVVDASSQSSGSTASSPRLTSPDYPYGPISPSQVPTPGLNTQHTFERVQFKSATANNGKRRASQQYFHLIVELYADIRLNGAGTPQWEKIAIRMSDKVVVRGRSPSHYKDERPENGSAGRGGSTGGGSSGYGTSGPSYSALPRAGYTNGAGSSNHVAGFRPSQNYDYKVSPTDSQVSSSTSSLRDAGDIKPGFSGDPVMRDVSNYQYFAASLYENVPGSVKIENTNQLSPGFSRDGRRFAVREDYPTAVPGLQWPVDGYPRFRGVETSRGYYPTDLNPAFS